MAEKNKIENPVFEMVLGSKMLTSNQYQEYLLIAREAIKDYLKHKFIRPSTNSSVDFPQFGGVFVTLWSPSTKNPELGIESDEILRGCVGRVESGTELVKLIQESAVSAATKDPRFPPLSLNELDKVRIEISILSNLQEIDNLDEIVIGKHGLLIEGNRKRGLLLPKVAERMRWNKRSFLLGVCHKAGLPDDCWPDQAKLYSFTTLTIEEESIRQ